MDFFDKLVGFLVAKNAIRSYQKDLQYDYLQKSAILAEKGEPWFVGKDVAEKLGYSNTSKAIQQHVDMEDKTTLPIRESGSNYKTRAILINESGLYSLILSSKLAEYEAKIAELKQLEGDHSDEIKELECFADYERDMVRIYKESLGEGEYSD